jgi:tetratricopeptide (TPR) repeat protein
MKVFTVSVKRSLALLTLLACCSALALGASFQEKDKQEKVSDAERKAAQKIDDAKDTAAKIAAASEFVNKYPKSALRPKIAQLLVAQISNTQDTAQKISFAESYLGTFSEASETKPIYPVLIESYINAKRVEDAFNAAAPWLEVNPNEADVLYLLSVTGVEEARRQNPKFLKQSEQYGLKAIELIEADKRPESYTVEAWNKDKVIWLPQLYQSIGLLSLLSGNTTDALTRLQKAIALSPNDPFNYVLLSKIKNDQYMAGAQQLKAMPTSDQRTDTEKKLTVQLDEVIDLYAHALGLMEGKPQFKPLHDQLLPDLTNYYKYRHNNTTDGMQELINKYKQPTTP